MADVKRLYRSRSNRVIAGVCGGLADYFNIDVTIVRIIFVVLGLMWGGGILLYLALIIIVPNEGAKEQDVNLKRRVEGAVGDLKASGQKIAKDWKSDKRSDQ